MVSHHGPAPHGPVGPEGPEDPAPGTPNRRGRVLLAAGLAAALVMTAVVAYRWGSAGRPSGPVAARPVPSSASAEQWSVAKVHASVFPSVVSIEATRLAAAPAPGQAAAASPATAGTGLVANVDGTILTALHVVQDATAIEVTFADGTKSAATIAGANPAIDIAALTPAQLPVVVVPAVLGGSLTVGDTVIAIGNQLGLTDSTTAGVVSGLNRSVPRQGAGNLDGLIQFDAAVNPGSSGGPLVNTRGQTVGIVVALANPTDAGTFIGVGFAVPIGSAVGGGGLGDGRQPQR
jgi:putative serine protease PepD